MKIVLDIPMTEQDIKNYVEIGGYGAYADFPSVVATLLENDLYIDPNGYTPVTGQYYDETRRSCSGNRANAVRMQFKDNNGRILNLLGDTTGPMTFEINEPELPLVASVNLSENQLVSLVSFLNERMGA